MVGRRSRRGRAGPADGARGPAGAGVSAALRKAGRRVGALGTRARGPRRSRRPCPASRASHLAGAGAAARAEVGGPGGGAGRGRRVRLGRRPALPSVDRSEPALSLAQPHVFKSPEAPSCHWTGHPYIRLLRGRVFLKGRLTEACGGSRLQGLPKPPCLDVGEPHRSGPLWRAHPGGRHGGPTARGRALLWGAVRGAGCACVYARACACLRRRGRICGGAGVCAQ